MHHRGDVDLTQSFHALEKPGTHYGFKGREWRGDRVSVVQLGKIVPGSLTSPSHSQ